MPLTKMIAIRKLNLPVIDHPAISGGFRLQLNSDPLSRSRARLVRIIRTYPQADGLRGISDLSRTDLAMRSRRTSGVSAGPIPYRVYEVRNPARVDERGFILLFFLGS